MKLAGCHSLWIALPAEECLRPAKRSDFFSGQGQAIEGYVVTATAEILAHHSIFEAVVPCYCESELKRVNHAVNAIQVVIQRGPN